MTALMGLGGEGQNPMTPGVPLLVVERDGREVAVLPADRKALVVK